MKDKEQKWETCALYLVLSFWLTLRKASTFAGSVIQKFYKAAQLVKYLTCKQEFYCQNPCREKQKQSKAIHQTCQNTLDIPVLGVTETARSLGLAGQPGYEYGAILPATSGISFSDNIGVNFRIQTEHLVRNEEENHHEVFLECSFLKANLSFFPWRAAIPAHDPVPSPKNWTH